jgi:hypothetical protein
MMAGARSLIAQRRQVLPNPGELETLAQPPDHDHFQLLPEPIAMAM